MSPIRVSVGLAAAVAVLAGCSSTPAATTEAVAPASAVAAATAEPTAAPTGTPSPSAPVEASPATEVDENAAILAAYREFFNRQVEISNAAPEDWRSMLEPFTADPALSSVLRGLKVTTRKGRAGYGVVRLNPKIVSILQGRWAAVEDCQDNSQAGELIVATGQVKTRGVKRDFAATTLRKGDDGAWRVTFVDYPGHPCR